MRIKILHLKQEISNYLEELGLNKHDTRSMADLIIEQEMVGNQFSPVGELAGKHARLIKSAKGTKEEVFSKKPSMMLIKGNGRPAPLITVDYLERVIEKAKKQGIYAFGIYDSTYNDFFDIYCRRIAKKDCVSLIFENGGPQGVVPHGGKKDILGTNPIAFGVPTNKYPIIFDAATAAHAWARIAQAKERGEKLPKGYLDKNGDVTSDPLKAAAILPFGGFKGYAINLLVDILSGALVRGKSGLDQPMDSQRYIGTLIIILDPAAFGDIKDFKDSTTKLVEDLLSTPSKDPKNPVKVPGQRGSIRMEKFKKEGYVEVENEEWNKFSKALETQKTKTT